MLSVENDSNGQIIVWTLAVCQRLLVVWLVVLTGCDAVDCSISGDNARQYGDNTGVTDSQPPTPLWSL